MSGELDPVDVRDVGRIVVTRHALVHQFDLVEYSDPHPRSGKPHVPLEAVLERPAADLRLQFVQVGNDGWAYATWVTDRLTKHRSQLEVPEGWNE